VTSNDLIGCRVEIDRAKKHVQELEAEIATFLQAQPYALVMEQEPKTRDQIYRIRIRKLIPDCWAGMVGDTIHNLRSALDLLAVALVIANGHTTSKSAVSETYFPIGADKKFFSTKKIRRASPAAIRLIERLKPYKGGIDDFWRLHQMDIVSAMTRLRSRTTGALWQVPARCWRGGSGRASIIRLWQISRTSIRFDFPVKDHRRSRRVSR
jgi:hypothetical protein